MATPVPSSWAETKSDERQLSHLTKLALDHNAAPDAPLLLVLATAFAAGFILNFMPCVLPVIGLKLVAFVQQAGDRRGRILVLNLWYSAGVMSVFLILATLAIFLGWSWGEQFSSVAFNVVLASVVFVFALSFLGVWEIPIPGFVGSGKTGELAEREGAPPGAFSKGVVDRTGHAVQWSVTGIGPHLGVVAAACHGLRGFCGAGRTGHGKSVSVDRCLPTIGRVSSQAGELGWIRSSR